MAGSGSPLGSGIKDVFYETRAKMGRDFTVRRFAAEALGGHVHPLILGYIEKGKRLPNEALVLRLAALRREDPKRLLTLLWRDRMVQGFTKELNRVLRAPKGMAPIDDGELAVAIGQAIAALPDDGAWMPVARWRKVAGAVRQRRQRPLVIGRETVARAEAIVKQQQLVEVRAGRARLRSHRFVAQGDDARRSLAIEFCGLFVKALLDELSLPPAETQTYLRNHYLHIEPDKIAEFQGRVDAAIDQLSAEYAADASARTRFLNVLVSSTPTT